MHRLLIIIVIFSCLSMLVSAQETVLDTLISKTVPEAEALLNIEGFRLAPIVQTVPADDNNANTVVDAITLDEDNLVQVTVAREYNVRLTWTNPAEFVRGLSGNELFTLINQTDEELPLRNLTIGSFDTSNWQMTLRADQCAQIWSYDEFAPFQIENCATIQGGNVARVIDTQEQFWITDETFEVFQNGIHRQTCVVSEGECDVWLSPNPIAEDMVDYVYALYDETQLVIYNNDDTRWMDLSGLSIDGIGDLANRRIWDTIAHPDLERLAPQQCVVFKRNQSQATLIDCDVIATFNTSQNEIFWTESFNLNDTLTGDNALACPPSQGDLTRCLLSR
ncbi:MAG: hypothetical protein AAFV93_10445 [Chloroflexota bacterium]